MVTEIQDESREPGRSNTSAHSDELWGGFSVSPRTNRSPVFPLSCPDGPARTEGIWSSVVGCRGDGGSTTPSFLGTGRWSYPAASYKPGNLFNKPLKSTDRRLCSWMMESLTIWAQIVPRPPYPARKARSSSSVNGRSFSSCIFSERDFPSGRLAQDLEEGRSFAPGRRCP